jgi:TfoX/Sxy family transcriptional regulator of competence genes
VSTSKGTIACLLEQLAPLDIRARAMFGEYGIYVGEKITALVRDDAVFLKPTPASAGMPEAAPYPGAKPSRVVSRDLIEDADALRALFAATADALSGLQVPSR